MSQVIIYAQDNGILSVIHPTAEALLSFDIAEIAEKDVPTSKVFDIVDSNIIPTDRVFRSAWRKGSGTVSIDVPTAKEITHEKRRAKRALEFAPLDEVIAKQLPDKSAAVAEAARADIRAKFEALQTEIDNCVDSIGLKTIIDREGL